VKHYFKKQSCTSSFVYLDLQCNSR